MHPTGFCYTGDADPSAPGGISAVYRALVADDAGGRGAKARAAALARLETGPGDPPLVVVATGPYIGEGFDCPILDALFLAAPVGYKGIVQWAGRILRAYPGKTSAEVHDYHDVRTSVLAATLARRAPGYTTLGFHDPHRIQFASASQAGGKG